MVFLSLVICLFSSTYGGVENGRSHWEYVGPKSSAHWSEEYPNCSGKSQSPIDIDVYDMDQKNLGGITFSDYIVDDGPVTGVVLNNGHTTQVSFENYKGYIHGGKLKGNYSLSQIHLHWGNQDTMGSEHTVLKYRFAMEMHAVHINDDKDIGDYVVLSYLYKAVPKVEKEQEALISQLLKTAATIKPDGEVKKEFDLSAKSLLKLFADDEMSGGFVFSEKDGNKMATLKDYCTYQGSLTTPPCSEIVTWLLTRKLRSISSKLLRSLRHIKSHSDQGLIFNNFRFPQPLYDRKLACNAHHKREKAKTVLSFTLDHSKDHVKIAIKEMKRDAIRDIIKHLKRLHLKVTDDDNLSGRVRFKNPEHGEQMASFKLEAGVVYFTVIKDRGVDLVFLRNDAKKQFFQMKDISGFGKIIQGNHALKSVKHSAHIRSVKKEKPEKDVYIDF